MNIPLARSAHLLLSLNGNPLSWLQDSDGVRTRARAKASTTGGGGDADGFAAAKGFVDRRRDADASAAQLDTVHACQARYRVGNAGDAALNALRTGLLVRGRLYSQVPGMQRCACGALVLSSTALCFSSRGS